MGYFNGMTDLEFVQMVQDYAEGYAEQLPEPETVTSDEVLWALKQFVGEAGYEWMEQVTPIELTVFCDSVARKIRTEASME